MSNTAPTIVLASSSKPRHALMQRLQHPFESCSPDIDEAPLPNEGTRDLVTRLAREKAQAVADRFPNALIIGSDQTAELNGEKLNKPGTHIKAVEQLQQVSGQKVQFISGLCLYNSATQNLQEHAEVTNTYFKPLTLENIENYLQKEQPYQCCGSIKSEGLGIALVEKIVSDDPTSLMGMPVIALLRMLAHEGVQVL